jgi:hypothetical protein
MVYKTFIHKFTQPWQIIDQKFLVPGYIHLKCDSDHSRIEKAKKIQTVKFLYLLTGITFFGKLEEKFH